MDDENDIILFELLIEELLDSLAESSRWGSPGLTMRVPSDDDDYYDVSLSPEELAEKYPQEENECTTLFGGYRSL